ncbi:MAG: NAD(P)/FAD-dependent oxidoreductase [Chloroflexota bacterium]|nr:NAD(P)/FAD-dependent oxidoreductase [Chloroflexota bacterium]
MIGWQDGRSTAAFGGARPRHRVVIVGGGFGGLYAAKALRGAPLDVTIVDRRNFHLFQPLLYQVATGALSPGDIASPLRAVLRHQHNATVLLGDVRGVDAARRRLTLADGDELEYDSLIVATGARHAYFGHDEWEPLAPGLKTLEEALEIRRRVLIAFEAAERQADPEAARAWLTFVVVGAGPTGVELAGALGEIANETLPGDFRTIDPRHARILLLELVDRALPSYPPGLSASAARSLGRLGVTVRTGTRVTAVDDGAVTVAHEGGSERIPARTVLWAAGVRASSLGRVLAEATGVEVDRAGRVFVAPDLSLPGHPEIFVIGDLATLVDARARPVPGVAPAAMQEGRFVADLIRGRLQGNASRPFRYHDKGSLATIGRGAGVADLGRLHFGGFLAWLAWLFVHLFYLVEFENRIVVLTRWTWTFFTRQRASRLITGHVLQPPIRRPVAAAAGRGRRASYEAAGSGHPLAAADSAGDAATAGPGPRSDGAPVTPGPAGDGAGELEEPIASATRSTSGTPDRTSTSAPARSRQ